MKRWEQGKLFALPHTEAMPTATAGNGITLPDLLRAPHERGRIALLLLLLTLTAAWIDMLSYLSLGRVFASFMTGNLLFIGLGVVQGNSGLLIRALVAVLVFLVGVTFGSFCLGRAPQQQSGTAWHNTFARYLLMEWLLLLVYAIIWRVTSNLSQQAGVQILLLCVAALGMGIQGGNLLTSWEKICTFRGPTHHCIAMSKRPNLPRSEQISTGYLLPTGHAHGYGLRSSTALPFAKSTGTEF